MKTFITGGTGFVGNNLARKLISEGNQVGLLIRKESKTWRTKDLYGKVDFFEGNLTQLEDLKNVIGEYNPDFIYHLATYGAYPSHQKDEETMLSTNLEGTLNLIAAADKIPIINIGSSSEYGIKNKSMKESDKCNPDNLYGETKLMQTLYCQEKEVPTLRLFSVYGPWEEHSRLIPVLNKAKLIGGELHLINGVRDYIYVEDVVAAILKATKNYNRIKGEVINIASGQQSSMAKILRILDNINTRHLEITWDFKNIQKEPQTWVGNISKAKEMLNWVPNISLEEGLKKTHEWWKQWKE